MKDKEVKIYLEKDTIGIFGLVVKAGVIAFFLFKFVMANFIDNQQETIFNLPNVKWIIGVSLLIYTIFFVFDIVKYSKQGKPEDVLGLLINRKGITDYHTEMRELGLIPWSEIEFIGTKDSLSGNYLIIKIKNPEDFIQKNPNIELKKILRNKQTKYGTPIAILVNGLDISSNELRKLAKIEFVKYKKW